MANNVIPSQKIYAAAGSNTQLQDVLTGIANTLQNQQDVTNTSGKNVPPQVKANVSYLKGTYTVAIQNPGTVSAVSALQYAQATEGATQQTNNSAITPIYHQIRVATSPQFNIGSNVQTFGGNTGSTQTNFTLTLPSGRFYFQVRSSYDGSNWNLWRNANGGATITTGTEGVTVSAAENMVWGEFALPGGQLMAVGSGLVSDGNSFGVPAGLYTSALRAIATPNGYVPQNDHLCHGIIAEAITVPPPTVPQALEGPADYPTLVSMKYKDGEGNVWTGTCSIFAMAFDPLGTNVVQEKTADGAWTRFTLPGGAMLAFGSGVVNDGAAMVMPTSVPWLSPAHCLSIISPGYAYSDTHHAHGIQDARFVPGGFTMQCGLSDGEGNRWGGTGNFFIIAWTPGIPETPLTNSNWLVLNLPGGGKVAFGGGQGLADYASFALPDGFTAQQMLAVATPSGYVDNLSSMSGVFQAAVTNGTQVSIQYAVAGASNYQGPGTFMAFCWL